MEWPQVKLSTFQSQSDALTTTPPSHPVANSIVMDALLPVHCGHVTLAFIPVYVDHCLSVHHSGCDRRSVQRQWNISVRRR